MSVLYSDNNKIKQKRTQPEILNSSFFTTPKDGTMFKAITQTHHACTGKKTSGPRFCQQDKQSKRFNPTRSGFHKA